MSNIIIRKPHNAIINVCGVLMAIPLIYWQFAKTNPLIELWYFCIGVQSKKEDVILLLLWLILIYGFGIWIVRKVQANRKLALMQANQQTVDQNAREELSDQFKASGEVFNVIDHSQPTQSEAPVSRPRKENVEPAEQAGSGIKPSVLEMQGPILRNEAERLASQSQIENPLQNAKTADDEEMNEDMANQVLESFKRENPITEAQVKKEDRERRMKTLSNQKDLFKTETTKSINTNRW